jgi:protein required for attachment to host cells
LSADGWHSGSFRPRPRRPARRTTIKRFLRIGDRHLHGICPFAPPARWQNEYQAALDRRQRIKRCLALCEKRRLLDGQIMKRDVLWVLVLNSTRARVLRDLRRDGTVAEPELVLRCEHRALRDIMADKPGRSFASAGGGRRSAMEYRSDSLREDERAFAGEVILLLETHRRAGEFDRLAVFASAEMLGLFRSLVPPPLRSLIEMEAPRNLMHESETGLARTVAHHVFGS